MAGEEKLTIKSEAKGFDETAKKVDKVTDAQSKLKDAVAETAEPTRDAADAQDKLNASEGDFLGLLAQLDPRLGSLADGMVKGSKVAGDFASSNIDLNVGFTTLTSAMAANANTLKLLSSAGGVLLAFTAMAKAISLVVAESKSLQETLDRLRDRQTDEDQSRVDIEKDTVRLSKRRREGGFSADEARESDRILKGILNAGRVEDVEGLKTNVAGLAGQVTEQDIEKLTIAGFQTDLSQGEDTRRRAAERALRRDSTQELFDRQRERQRDKEARRNREASREAISGDPTLGNVHLDALIRANLDAGADFDAVKDLVEGAIKKRADLNARLDRTIRPHQRLQFSERALRGAAGDAGALVDDASDAQSPFVSLFGFGQENQPERAAARQVINIFNHFEHSKNLAPSQRSQRADIINGEILSRARGER